jgi:hypothetical protein
MEPHPDMGGARILGHQPLWLLNPDVPGVSRISAEEFEAAWRAAG